MSTPAPFDDLTEALKSRNDEAVRLVVDMFQRRLRAIADAKMPAAVKAKEDADDVVGTVWRTFFRRIDAGKIVVKDLESLWSLLAQITARKAGRRNRKYLFTGKSSANKEARADADGNNPVDAVMGDAAGPEDAAMLVDLVEWMLAKIGDPTARQIVVMWLQDRPAAEIAAATGRSERTVFRVQERVRDELVRKFREGEDDDAAGKDE
ncbi:MAG: hypothetical protein K2P78_14200 [Gemmataceae bacterium]|nr:hypothetical protein [Gemmataceae bacterium]